MTEPRPRRADDVLRLLLNGRSTAEIATELSLSAHTVSNHVRDLLHRHGARNRADLMRRLLLAERDDLGDQLAACRRALAVLDRRGRQPGGEV